MKNTDSIGNATEAMVLAALVKQGKKVLVPFGQGQRYDLAIDEGDRFVRVQCKTGKLKGGVVDFRNYSTTGAGDRIYGDSVDAYGVFCPQTGKVYFILASECSRSITSLRLTPAQNGMKGLRMAAQYEI